MAIADEVVNWSVWEYGFSPVAVLSWADGVHWFLLLQNRANKFLQNLWPDRKGGLLTKQEVVDWLVKVEATKVNKRLTIDD